MLVQKLKTHLLSLFDKLLGYLNKLLQLFGHCALELEGEAVVK